MPDLMGHLARPPLRFLAQGWAGFGFGRDFGSVIPFPKLYQLRATVGREEGLQH